MTMLFDYVYPVLDHRVLDEAVESSLKQAAVWDDVKDKLHSALSLSVSTAGLYRPGTGC